MSYFEFTGHIVNSAEVIGIGPLFRRDRVTDIPTHMLYFDLFCKGNTIRVESEVVSVFDQDKEEKAKKLFSSFKEMYEDLLLRVRCMLSD